MKRSRMFVHLVSAVMVCAAAPAYAQEFVWPVGDSDSVAAYQLPCGDGPTCYFLSSEKNPDPSKIWRDSNPFQKYPLTEVSDPEDGLYHLGADLNLGSGAADGKQTVRSIGAGKIVSVLDNVPGFGKMIFIEHASAEGPITSVYAHVDWLGGKPPPLGEIGKGEPIAEIGDGDGAYKGKDHLHFEIRKGRDLTPGCAYTGRKYDSEPSCKTSSVRVTQGPQGQVDPILFLASAASPYHAQYKEPLRDAWNLPAKTRVLSPEKCTKSDARELGVKLPGPTACMGIVRTEDGLTFLIVKHHLREVEEGQWSVWAVDDTPEIAGYLKARNGVVSIWKDQKIGFLGVDYTGWNKDPSSPPYFEYGISEGKTVLLNSPARAAAPSTTAGTRSSGSGTARSATTASDGGVKEIACSVAQWEGTITVVSDLFECDTPRAIASLSEGRNMMFAVRSVSFANGKFRASFSQIPTSAQQAQQRMNDPGQQFGWGDWMTRTQTNNYTISCEFPASAGARLPEGKSIEVSAKLVSYSNGNAMFACE